MMHRRFTNFVTAAVLAIALWLGGLAAATTASAETYQRGVVGNAHDGKAVVHWGGNHDGSARLRWHN
jgi:Spy/CpxP family protein refolding chaperone